MVRFSVFGLRVSGSGSRLLCVGLGVSGLARERKQPPMSNRLRHESTKRLSGVEIVESP